MLGDPQPPLLGQHRSVDQVHLLGSNRRKNSGQHCRFEHNCVVLGNLPLVGDVNAHKLVLGQVGQQLSHQGGNRDKGRQQLVGISGHEGRVDRVAGGSPFQHCQHLFRRLNGHLALGLPGGRPKMGCGHHLGVGDQLPVLRRLLNKHVQGGAGQPVRFQGFQQGVFVYQLAARHVDQVCPGFNKGQLPRADQVGCIRCQRRMQGDEVGLGQQFVQGQQFRAQPAGIVGPNKWIIGQQVHPETGCPSGYFGTDATQADDAQVLVAHLNAHECAAPPLALLQ